MTELRPVPPVAAPPWLQEACTIADHTLGPRSVEALRRPAVRDEVQARLDRGLVLEDALLGAIFELARIDRGVAGEFFGHFLGVVLEVSGRHDVLAPGLRRLMDADDLVQSVLADLWPELDALHFETRAQFLSLLAGRVRWKASDHGRKLNRRRRREDLRVPETPEDLALAAEQSSPVTRAGRAERAEQVALAMGRLSERDRLLLRLHLRGESMERIAEETGLARETARKALQRARARLGEVLPG